MSKKYKTFILSLDVKQHNHILYSKWIPYRYRRDGAFIIIDCYRLV